LTPGTEITRFNALRHGVLSRYTVLPWEDAGEYRAVVEALVAEHVPQGPVGEWALHSALIPSSLMIGHHFSASARWSARSAAGVC
jgi:hypothetical protein